MDPLRHATIADALAGSGWIMLDDFLPDAHCRALRASAEQAALVPARVGNGVHLQHRPSLRGDHTAWIEHSSAQAGERDLRAVLEGLRVALNESLFAGLEDVECHYAHYPPGASYGRHLDRFRDDDRRVVSCVIYLNRDWAEAHGGHLRIYSEGDELLAHVAPESGRAVFFLSERFPHEVLPGVRDRYSVAAWFLRRPFGRGLV